jgi:hypothetical protein
MVDEDGDKITLVASVTVIAEGLSLTLSWLAIPC